MMKRMLLLLAAAVVALAAPAAFADEACGYSCPPNHLCVERGVDNLCWQACRMDNQCASNCCIEVEAPYAIWICGAESECSGEPDDGDSPDGEEDGDEPDGEEDDGDAAADDGDDSGDGPCDGESCADDELCIAVQPGQPFCSPICEHDAECDDECCTQFQPGYKACVPAVVACPADRIWVSDNPSRVVCSQPTPGSFGLWPLLLVAFTMMVFRHAQRRTRK
ncbi:MAG: hypothetical protein C4523_08270 [Myxococcales bacterium]|nr:MAG: hypothetical protein C4523_08270 [Myxococcales bacterium]